ncbi:hypothetical protein U9M48_010079 [Paspalum notatum var. saurae]|uniref:Uncharacterized protein n=1 Tax=Paspalum notatum var. saurae TaxID=547442 RepID=A0AAQ3SSD1_PASNO
MAKMTWRKRTASKAPSSSAAGALAGGDGTRMPRGGYVPMRLVGDGGCDCDDHETVLVPLALLNEPRMAELLEMAERRFGYGQPGVLRIPCDARRFEQLMGLPGCGLHGQVAGTHRQQPFCAA